MSEETIKDIVAEIRRDIKLGNNYYAANLPDRIEAAAKLERTCRRSIEIPVKIVPTCSAARAQRRLELLRAEMSDMVNMPPGTKYRVSPQAIIDEIDDTLATRPRNCDVFADALWDTISRAWQEWLLTPEFNKRKIGGMKEFCYWILGPAKEGAAK